MANKAMKTPSKGVLSPVLAYLTAEHRGKHQLRYVWSGRGSEYDFSWDFRFWI
jgi:hypothetical protein